MSKASSPRYTSLSALCRRLVADGGELRLAWHDAPTTVEFRLFLGGKDVTEKPYGQSILRVPYGNLDLRMLLGKSCKNEGYAIFNPETASFHSMGCYFGTVYRSVCVDAQVRIPEGCWFDRISIDCGQGDDQLRTSVILHINNGPFTLRHLQVVQALEQSLCEQISAATKQVIGFQLGYAEVRWDRAQLARVGDQLIGVIPNLDCTVEVKHFLEFDIHFDKRLYLPYPFSNAFGLKTI